MTSSLHRVSELGSLQMHDLNAWLCQTDPHNCGRMHDGYDQSSLKNSGELAMCGTSIMRQPPLGQEKKVPKVKEKEKRRNSEKRKEKSRDAARCRRGKESEIFNELLSYLPLTTEVASTLDKMSILRLTLNSLRLEKFVEPTRKSFKDEAWIKFGESDDALCDDPALNFMDGFVMILTDDGEQLEPIFISEGLQLEMGLPVAEMLGVSLETFVHPCDYQELRSVFLGFKDNASEKIEKTMQVRMKCTISAKGRVVNIKSAAYKVVKFQLKVFKRNDVQYMSAICEPMGPCFAKLRPTRRSFLISDVKTGLDFTTQHGLNLVFKSVEGFPEFIGFSADDLKELSLYDLIHPADLFEMSGHFKELFSKGYCDTGFYRFLARCGGYCWISSRAQLVQDTTGKPLTIQCVHYCLGGMIMDSDCVLATFQQPERQQHHLQQQQQQRQQLKDQPARRGLPIGSELTTGSFMDVSLLEDGLREIERQQASAQDFSILCPTQSTTASIPAVPGPLSSSASSSTTTATTTAATTTATTGSASSTTTAATTTTLVDNDSRNKHHVLIFVPSGAGGGQVDSGALNGRSESCLSVSAAPSVPSRHVGGGPSPVAGGRALGFVSFPQQSLRLTATYVNAAELSAGQPSPVAVVGQSKNNQLDNNNTAERAGCTSLQLASFSLAEAAAAAAGASAVEAGSAPAVRGGQVVVQLREKQTPNANQESTIRLSPRVNPSSAVVGCNNDLAAAAAAAAAADSVLLRRPYSTVASVPDGSLISAVSASSSSSSVAAAAAATHALSSSSLPRATNAGVVPTATVAVPSTTTVAAVSGQSRVPSSVTPRSNVEFRCSGAGGQIAAAEATNNVFQDRCPGASVHQRAGSGGNSVLGASFIGVHAAYAQQQILPHQQQRGDGGKQLCADERIVLPGVADCVPDLVSSTDEDDEEDCSGDDCPVLESPASACETTNENRGNYSTDQLDSTNLNLTVATTAAAAAARSACCVDRKQLLGSGNGRNELAYREEQELTSQVPSPKAIVVNDAYDGALIGADHLLGHHHHLHDQLVERQLRNDDATQNLIDSDQSADKWETSIPARASIAAPKRLRGSEPEHTDVDGNDNGCEDFAKTRRLLDTRTSDCEESNPQQSLTSVLTSTLSVFAPRTEEMSPGFLQIKGGQVLTCEEPGADLTHLAPTAGDSAMPLEVEFEVCDEIPENLFPSLLDSAGCSPLSRSPPYEDPLLGYSDLSHALLDDLSMNLQLEADLLPGDWPLPSSSSTSVSNHRDRKSDCRSFRNSNASSTSNNSSKSALTATSKSMLATLLQSEPVPSSVSQKQRAMVHDWGGTTQPLPESMQMSPKRNNTPVKFVPQKVQSTLTINALKRPLSVSQRSSIEQLSQQPQSHTQQQQQQQQQQRSSSACPIKRRKTIDTGELQPKPVEKNGSVLMKLLVSGEDLPNGYSCRVLQGQRPGCHDKDRDLRSAQDYLHSLTSQHDHDPSSVNSDTSDFCHLLSADDDLLMALAAVTQE